MNGTKCKRQKARTPLDAEVGVVEAAVFVGVVVLEAASSCRKTVRK